MTYNQINPKNALYILNLFSKQTDLSMALEGISNWLEKLIPDAIVSIMLFSEEEQSLSLVHTNNKSFSESYKNVLQNLKIGPNIGACGAAAYYKEVVICENLVTHANWKDFQVFVESERIYSCWSVPVINLEGKLYGTFAAYYREPKSPKASEIKMLNEVTVLLAFCFDYYNEHKYKNEMYEKYNSFFDHHPAAVYEYDLDGYIVDVNMTSKKINGFEAKQIIGCHYLEFIPTEHQNIVEKSFVFAKKGYIQQLKVPICDALNQIYWADLTYMPIFQNGVVNGTYAIVKDITEHYKLEEDLNLLKRGIEASPNGLTIITKENLDYKIVYANSAFLHMTGYSKEEAVGGNCKFIQGSESDSGAIKKILNAIQNDKKAHVTLKNYKKDGTWFWNEITLSPVFNHHNICTHFICTQQDVTKKRIDQEYITYQQTHDQLTDLVNRRAFEEILESAFQNKDRQPHSLFVALYIDLDNFSTVNQDLGYAEGDDLIKEVSQRLQMIIKNEDILSRFSADSFALFINRSITENEVVFITEEILKQLSVPFNINGHYIYLTTSIGIADITALTTSSGELLYNAIQAMSKAKNDQMSAWKWYVDSIENKEKINELKLRHDLTLALELEQFKLNYQPIIDSRTKEIVGVEALIRWYHPERGLISPAHFIPLAERSGQIISIGNWVLNQACKDIADINANRVNPLKLSVNLSPVQFKDVYLLNRVHEVISKYNFAPELLKIEITEGVLMMNAERSIEILESLQKIGVKISIDDFGTGYSSFSYLCKFPINQIKLDRSFISFLPIQQKYAAIVTSLIDMAEKLALEVVAEGVETLQQADFLTHHKCKLLQGFYFSKPISIDGLKELLK